MGSKELVEVFNSKLSSELGLKYPGLLILIFLVGEGDCRWLDFSLEVDQKSLVILDAKRAYCINFIWLYDDIKQIYNQLIIMPLTAQQRVAALRQRYRMQRTNSSCKENITKEISLQKHKPLIAQRKAFNPVLNLNINQQNKASSKTLHSKQKSAYSARSSKQLEQIQRIKTSIRQDLAFVKQKCLKVVPSRNDLFHEQSLRKEVEEKTTTSIYLADRSHDQGRIQSLLKKQIELDHVLRQEKFNYIRTDVLVAQQLEGMGSQMTLQQVRTKLLKKAEEYDPFFEQSFRSTPKALAQALFQAQTFWQNNLQNAFEEFQVEQFVNRMSKTCEIKGEQILRQINFENQSLFKKRDLSLIMQRIDGLPISKQRLKEILCRK